MNDKIKKYLFELEEKMDIKILFACETGSRAWGFPSPDSDFDVRFIYVHKNDWYLTVNDKKDTIEMMLDDNEIDISGWELKKSLKLLLKSNAALLERLQSPIVYIQDLEFSEDIQVVAKQCYSRIATVNHYLSMAKKMLAEISGVDEFKLKKFLYALRATLVCKWIIEKEEIPPIEFSEVYNNLRLPENIIIKTEKLIELKATKAESYFLLKENDLLNFMKNMISDIEDKKNKLPTAKFDVDSLNSLLKKYVYKYDNRKD